MNQTAVILYNPAAGKGDAGKNLQMVKALLEKHGFAHDLILTERPGHALELARQACADGRSLVVAAGGDGTVNEVINGLMTAPLNGSPRPALGVLPIGSGNDFAFGQNIPVNLDQAASALAKGTRRTIDVGRVIGGSYPEGRYFGNGVGLGFDTVVGFEAAKIKWLRGAASYLAGLVKTIFLYAKAPVYDISIDGGPSSRRACLMVSIMNGRRMGGAFLMTPDSKPDDGSFDLCLAGQVPQVLILPLAMKFLNGSQTRHKAVQMTRARSVTVCAVQGTIPAHADGETICEAGEALAIELIPAALEIITQ